MNEHTEATRRELLALIAERFGTDAAFEEEAGLKSKTVSNWRLGRSSSFMKMLPELAERFRVNVGELMDMPLRRDTSELSEEELHLLHLYRRSRTMPEKMRHALRETLEKTIMLYISSYNEVKANARKKTAKKTEKPNDTRSE